MNTRPHEMSETHTMCAVSSKSSTVLLFSMQFDVEIMLRASDRVFTERLSHDAEPRHWTGEDVDQILRKILRAIGGVLRHAASLGIAASLGAGFPWGTLVVNVSGAWAMGTLTALAANGPGAWPPVLRQGLGAGLLGGYTTFSAFSLQTMALVAEGRWGAGALNVGLSVGLCVAACWAGFATAAGLTR